MSELTDPFTRLQVLPTAMAWRGVWNNADQYYKNDVVLSPTNNATYLLFGATTDRGSDPVSNADWFEVFPHTTGLEGLVAGVGIQITPVPSANNPTITNTGVRTMTANTGLAWNGITNTITNTGLLGIRTDPSSTTGLFWDASASTLYNAGVVSAFRIGINNTGTPQNQVWENAGIVALNGSANISVSNDPSGNATVGNTGIINIIAGSNIFKSGTPNNPSLSVRGIDITTLLIPTGGMTPNPIAGVPAPNPFNKGYIPVSLAPTSILQQQLLNPPLDPNPTWVFDFTGWWVDYPQVQGISLGLFVGFRDNITAGGPYEVFSYDNEYLNEPTPSGTIQGFANCGMVPISLHSFRSAGLQTITDVFILNQTGYALTLVSWESVKANYYPVFSV